MNKFHTKISNVEFFPNYGISWDLHSIGKSQSQLQCISWERLSSHVQGKLSHIQAAGAIVKT